jgi:hypothetical protein
MAKIEEGIGALDTFFFFAIEIEIDSKDSKFKPKFEPFQNRKLGIWFKDSKCKPVTF